MGLCKAKEPMCPKECVRPTLMIKSATHSLMMRAPAQNTPKAPTDPRVHGGRGPLVAVLKVLKPTAKGLVDILDEGRQALPISTRRLGSNGIQIFAPALLGKMKFPYGKRIEAPII